MGDNPTHVGDASLRPGAKSLRRRIRHGFYALKGRAAAAEKLSKGEFGQIKVRMIYAVIVWSYVLIGSLIWGLSEPQVFYPMLVALGGAVYAAAVFLHMLATLRHSPARWAVGMVGDMVSLGLFMHLGNEVTAPFFPVYLWVVLGNGFRYGIKRMLIAAGVALASFVGVVMTTPVWHDHLMLSLGLILSLILIPGYVASLIKQLHEAKAQAERASAAKSDFLATVSHEVRTPLNAIIGLSDILRGSPLEGEQRQMVRSIGQAGRALFELMSDILDLARIESGKVEQEKQPYAVYQLLASLEAIIAPQAKTKGLQFASFISLDTPAVLRGDRRHIQEVLINLLVNAVKFTETGGALLAIETADEASGPVVRMTVRDTGAGIPADELDLIFESFTQSSLNRRASGGGAGLGLSITKRLVEAMGGQIVVQSVLGQGSTFVVTLPLKPADEDDMARRTSVEDVHVFALGACQERCSEIFAGTGADCRIAETLDDLVREVAAYVRETGERPVVMVPDSIGLRDQKALRDRLVGMEFFSDPLVLLAQTEQAGPVSRRSSIGYALTEVPLHPDTSERQRLHALLGTLLHDTGEEDVGEIAKDAKKLNILIAEDNRVNRQIASRIVTSLGHESSSVENGEQVLEALESMHFDAILMDVNMPVLSGLEATQMVRMIEGQERHTPIIGLTADATPDSKRQCLEAGMDEVIFKPVSAASMRTALQGVSVAKMQRAADKGGEADIVQHPRLLSGGSAVIDSEKLKELEQLGSGAFLETVKAEFVEDAEGLLDELRETVINADLKAFRDTNHAMRSMAANMGANRILELCSTTRQLTADSLKSKGEPFLTQLEIEIRLVREALLGGGPDSAEDLARVGDKR